MRIVFPLIQSWRRVDIRVKAVDVPDQNCMTKDNVSVNVNAVLYYKVSNAEKAILEVEMYNYAVSQLSQTTMRDVVGEVTLDKLLLPSSTVSSQTPQVPSVQPKDKETSISSQISISLLPSSIWWVTLSGLKCIEAIY